MAQDERKFWIWQFAVHDMQIRATHGTGEHLE
jgi:hypothetical protein